MKKWLAVLVCAFLMFAGFVACSDSQKQESNVNNEVVSNKKLILGKWEAEVDMTEKMEEIFAATESMGAAFKVSDFKMKFFFTFDDNSLMKLEVDEVTLSESFNKFFVGIKESMHDYFEEMIKQSNLDMTVEELLAKSNLDLDKLVDDMSSAALDAMKIDEMSYDCYYEVGLNKLYSYDAAGKRDDEEYIEIEFPDENTMKFVGVKTKDTGNILEMITELKKVKE